MSETRDIIESLKKVLRAQKITYARVAQELGLSETSVKRCFAQHNFTLARLVQICELAGVSLLDLAKKASESGEAISRLTPEQERRLTQDPKLLMVVFLTLNNWTPEEITFKYALTEQEVLARLLQMDRLGMIELLPGNRVKRLVARNFSWHADGPVQRYFEEQVKQHFLGSAFAEPLEHLRFVGGLISHEHIHKMHAAIERLTLEMDRYLQEDADLPLSQKRGVGAVFAIRPWEVPAFNRLRRNPAERNA